MSKSKLRAYLFLFSTTAFLVMALYLTPRLIGASLTRVQVTPAACADMKTVVTCSGAISSAREREIYQSTTLMVQQVKVSVGDYVEAGAPLFTVDRSQTLAALQNGTAAALTQSAAALAGSDNSLLQQYQAQLNGPSASASGVGSSLSVSGSPSVSSGTSPDSAAASEDIPSVVRAPVSGTVTRLNVRVGSFTDPTQPCAVVIALNQLQVTAQVDELSVKSVCVGQKATVSGEGFSGSYAARVTKIAPAARQIITDSGTQTVVDVTLSLDDVNSAAGGKGNLKPGLSADVSIVTAERPASVTVPYDSIVQDDLNREYVFVCQGNRLRKAFISTGTEYQDAVEIKSGLKAGDLVVRQPSDQLTNGQIVRPGRIK